METFFYRSLDTSLYQNVYLSATCIGIQWQNSQVIHIFHAICLDIYQNIEF